MRRAVLVLTTASLLACGGDDAADPSRDAAPSDADPSDGGWRDGDDRDGRLPPPPPPRDGGGGTDGGDPGQDAGPGCVPSAETCNGADDDCDDAVDEGLARDRGEFAGCENYRWLLDEALRLLDRNAETAARYTPSDAGDYSGIYRAVTALIARAALYRDSAGALPGSTRLRILRQAVAQADALLALEVGRSAMVQGWRSDHGRSHACRGWVAESDNPVVSQYVTGQALYGIITTSRAIYERTPSTDRAMFESKAALYHDVVGQVVDHWMDESAPNHFFTANEPDGRAHWFCGTEDRSSCIRSDGQRLVKWNKQTWTWRAVAVWNDVANDHRGMGTTYRRIRAMRFTRWMKADMLATSAPWEDDKPYVWHSWADWSSTWSYIEDASHGSWDVGLMAEAWEGDWREWDVDETSRIMGSGSAGRFRATYMDHLARPDACVWLRTDGRHDDLLITGRRSALSEWAGVAAGDADFLLELQQDITGECEGVDLVASGRAGAILGLVRLFAEGRDIRGE